MAHFHPIEFLLDPKSTILAHKDSGFKAILDLASLYVKLAPIVAVITDSNTPDYPIKRNDRDHIIYEDLNMYFHMLRYPLVNRGGYDFSHRDKLAIFILMDGTVIGGAY